jgi:uncharacterized membrane protein YphA (DoxX/SURF4 family)
VTIAHEIGRILICGFFLAMVVKNLLSWQDNVKMVAQVLRFPRVALAFGFAVEVIGAVLVLFGIQPVAGAIILAGFVVVATVLFLRFWRVADPMERHFVTLLFSNNFAILGGILLLL